MQFALVTSPSFVWACAVCGAVTEEQRGAFLGTTIVLSLLPLAMMGLVAYVVYKQLRPEKGRGFQRLTGRNGAAKSSASTKPNRPATPPSV